MDLSDILLDDEGEEGYYSLDEFKALLQPDSDADADAGARWQHETTKWRRQIFWRNDEGSSCSNHQLANKLLLVLKHLIPSSLGDKGIIQFWVAREVGTASLHQLTTSDQPFTFFGVKLPKGLCEYRKRCMGYDYLVKDEDEDGDKESWGPIGRVFRSGVTESSPDVGLYSDKEHPLRDVATATGIGGCFAIPVFDCFGGNKKPVAVLEWAFNGSPQGFESDYINSQVVQALQAAGFSETYFVQSDVAVENEFREVLGLAIDSVPELHLAQCWIPIFGLSNNCMCMKRSDFWAAQHTKANSLPDINSRMFGFLKAGGYHKVKSDSWIVGLGLPSTNSSFFCQNICDLSICEYPLAHYAQRAGLSSYFAVCLRNREERNKSCVIEFFFQFDSRQDKNPIPILKSLLQIIDRQLKGYELSSGQSIGTEIPVNVSTTNDEVGHDDGCHDLKSSGDAIEGEQHNISSMNPDGDVTTHSKKRGRHNKEESINITLQDLEPHFGTTLNVASEKLGVSTSTIKHFCRENNIQRWPTNPKNKGNIVLFRKPTSTDDVQSSKRQDFHGSSSKNPPPTTAPLHILDTNTRESAQNATKLSDDDVFIIMAKYKDHRAKIELHISSKMEKLNQEVMKRFNIEAGSFKLKYLDSDNEFTLLVCDDDWHLCLKNLKASAERKQQSKSKEEVEPLCSLIVHVECESGDQPSKKKKISEERTIMVDNSDGGDVDVVASTIEQEIMSKYRGRWDYVVRDQLDAEWQQYLDCFIRGDFRGEHIWSKGWLAVRPSSLMSLLFDEAICGDVISSYLNVMCSAEYRTEFGICNRIAYLSASTTENIISLIKNNTENTMKIDGYEWVIDNMIPYFRDEVCGMRRHIERGTRYIVVPINDVKLCHWYMLAVDIKKKQIYEFNSVCGAASIDTQRWVVTFLTGWLKCLGHEIQSDVVKATCRQQENGSKDCGVFISLWSEGLLFDSPLIWTQESDRDIKGYRAWMAYSILKDTHSKLQFPRLAKNQ